jgi:glutamate 5-kinase
MKRIIIKIGSRILTDRNGNLNKKVILMLADDINHIRKEKEIEVIIVSSGAVSAGRSVIDLIGFKVEREAIDYDRSILEEQILAAVGQPKVMDLWIETLGKFSIHCAQLLTTRSVFASRKDYLSIRSVAINLIRLGVIPIFNENDVLSPEELDFTDNDQQACMIAAMLSADKLIILTDVEGVYDGSPKDSKSKLISVIKEPTKFLAHVDKLSGSGKGGMRSKLLTADLATALGIDMHIADGLIPRVISKIMSGEKIGTYFPAKSKEKLKPIKSWLASAAASEGKIIVSTYLADILKRKQAASVLFSGIEKVSGNFKEGNTVEICHENGATLGRGLVRYGSDELKKQLVAYKKMSGKEKASLKTSSIIAVHYDYLVFC